jgi:hypothetical protein
MMSSRAALQRIKGLKAFANMRETDFRSMVFGQNFTGVTSGGSSATPQQFPGGAIILGIDAHAYIAGAAAAAGQSANNKQLFALAFSYTNGEALTPGGPIPAEALLGSGREPIFPSVPLVVAPTQSLLATVQNLTTTTLTIHIAYHALVYRFAS